MKTTRKRILTTFFAFSIFISTIPPVSLNAQEQNPQTLIVEELAVEPVLASKEPSLSVFGNEADQPEIKGFSLYLNNDMSYSSRIDLMNQTAPLDLSSFDGKTPMCFMVRIENNDSIEAVYITETLGPEKHRLQAIRTSTNVYEAYGFLKPEDPSYIPMNVSVEIVRKREAIDASAVDPSAFTTTDSQVRVAGTPEHRTEVQNGIPVDIYSFNLEDTLNQLGNIGLDLSVSVFDQAAGTNVESFMGIGESSFNLLKKTAEISNGNRIEVVEYITDLGEWIGIAKETTSLGTKLYKFSMQARENDQTLELIQLGDRLSTLNNTTGVIKDVYGFSQERKDLLNIISSASYIPDKDEARKKVDNLYADQVAYSLVTRVAAPMIIGVAGGGPAGALFGALITAFNVTADYFWSMRAMQAMKGAVITKPNNDYVNYYVSWIVNKADNTATRYGYNNDGGSTGTTAYPGGYDSYSYHIYGPRDNCTCEISGSGRIGSIIYTGRHTTITSVIVTGGVTDFEFSGFSNGENNVNVHHVSLPSSLKKITRMPTGDYSAHGGVVRIPDGVEEIGENAMNGACGQRVELPSSIRLIGKNAFSYSSIQEIVFLAPYEITEIGEYAFGNMPNLQSINIPDSVTTIGNYAFVNNTSLKSLTLPRGLTSIGNNAFYGSALSELTLPDSLQSVGNAAFIILKSKGIVNKPLYLPRNLTSMPIINADGDSFLTYNAPNFIVTAACDYTDQIQLRGYRNRIYYEPQATGWTNISNAFAVTSSMAFSSKNYTLAFNKGTTKDVYVRIKAQAAPAVADSGSRVVTWASPRTYLDISVAPLKAGRYMTLYSDNENVVKVNDVDPNRGYSDSLYSVTLTGKGTATLTVLSEDGRAQASCTLTVRDFTDSEYQNAQRSSSETPSSGSGGSNSGTGTSTSAATGSWIKSGSRWWYRHADGSYTRNNWERIDGTWYLFDKDGWMLTGWQKVGGTWYYLKGSGAMATGWVKLGSTWYYLKPSGAMATGWLKLGSTWYYLKPSGAMATGWQKVGNTWYYLKPSGAMATGWQEVGNTWYYLKSSGAMATGWIKLGNTWYYLDGSGAMLASTSRTINGKTYYFNASGACTNP